MPVNSGILLETSRLMLRSWRPEDIPAAHTWFGDPRVMRYIGHGRPDANLAGTRARILGRYRGLNRGGLGVWPVALRDGLHGTGGRLIGHGVLIPLEGRGPEVEVGYALARAFWGRGLGTELASALLEYGFQRLGLPRIVAVTHPANVASQSVLLKAGMRRLGGRRCYGMDVAFFGKGNPG